MNQNKNKYTILKSAGLLIGVIILFSGLSRYLLSDNYTLSQYAEDNPELAYGNISEGDSTKENTEAPANAQAMNPSAHATDENSSEQIITGSGEDITTGANIGGNLVGNGALPSPERFAYKPDFYYEPLSPQLQEYITGVSYPEEGADEISYEDLSYVHVLYYDFNKESTQGELICNNAISKDLVEIFYELYIAEYQIEKITLIEQYDGDDTASMEDNNTSCFNYRTVDDSNKLSKHALGLAIDINPFYNPYIRYTKDGGQIISPANSEIYVDRTSSFPYKIDTQDLCYRLFIEHGFTWGGNWNSSKDYQHFQKVID